MLGRFLGACVTQRGPPRYARVLHIFLHNNLISTRVARIVPYTYVVENIRAWAVLNRFVIGRSPVQVWSSAPVLMQLKGRLHPFDIP